MDRKKHKRRQTIKVSTALKKRNRLYRNKRNNDDVIDLETTVNQFGFKSGFSVQKYIHDYYKSAPSTKAVDHMRHLKERKELISRQLQENVTLNYSTFIHTSKEITSIENNMVKLNNYLNEYKNTLRELENIRFGSNSNQNTNKDTNNLHHHRQEVGVYTKLNNNTIVAIGTLNDALELQELAEDLRSDIYERNLENAVSGIEVANEKYQELIIEYQKNQNNDVDIISDIDDEDISDVETMNENSNIIQNDVMNIIKSLEKELISVLLHDLRNHNLKNYERRQLVGYLLRLQQHDLTLAIFLSQQTKEIILNTKKVKLKGDSTLFVKELSNLICKNISDTIFEYQKLFSTENDTCQSLSVVITWMIQEIEKFYAILRKQIFKVNVPSLEGFNAFATALKYLFEPLSTYLSKRGLDINFHIFNLVQEDVVALINECYASMEHRAANQLENDSFLPTECWVQDQRKLTSSADTNEDIKRKLKLSASTKYLYLLVREMLQNITPLLQIENVYTSLIDHIHVPLVEGFIHLFEGYLLAMANIAKTTLSDQSSLVIIANSFYLADDLVPRVEYELKKG